MRVEIQRSVSCFDTIAPEVVEAASNLLVLQLQLSPKIEFK